MSWVSGKGYGTSKRARFFLAAYAELCERHKLTLGHEDGHGAFIVEPYTPLNVSWVFNAHLDPNLPDIVLSDPPEESEPPDHELFPEQYGEGP